jgi:hypothetical protein
MPLVESCLTLLIKPCRQYINFCFVWICLNTGQISCKFYGYCSMLDYHISEKNKANMFWWLLDDIFFLGNGRISEECDVFWCCPFISLYILFYLSVKFM